MTSPPSPSIEALHAYQETADTLHQWAPIVHQLVCDRIAALVEAIGPFDSPLETAEDYVARVYAGIQRPFPPGVSIYDNQNENRGYDHVAVAHGLEGDGGLRIVFTGWYGHWSPGNGEDNEDDEGSYERRQASIHCPTWLVTHPNGINLYFAQTTGIAADIRRQIEKESAAISATLREIEDNRPGSSPT
jgi:hypothetical protein